jgi:hypothetical protein
MLLITRVIIRTRGLRGVARLMKRYKLQTFAKYTNNRVINLVLYNMLYNMLCIAESDTAQLVERRAASPKGFNSKRGHEKIYRWLNVRKGIRSVK